MSNPSFGNILVKSNLVQNVRTYEDSLQHCVDSLSLLLQYNKQGVIQTASIFATGQIATLCLCILGLLGSWLTMYYKGKKIVASLHTLAKQVERMERKCTEMKQQMEEEVKNNFTAIAELKTNVNSLWSANYAKSKAPMVLNDRGYQLLQQSGIANLVDHHRGDILLYLRTSQLTNSYEVQEAIIQYMNNLSKHPEIMQQIELCALKARTDAYALLIIGTMYISESILADLGFKIEHMELHQAM